MNIRRTTVTLGKFIHRLFSFIFCLLLFSSCLPPEAPPAPVQNPAASNIISRPVSVPEKKVDWNDFQRAISLYVQDKPEDSRNLLTRITKLNLTPEQHQLAFFLQGIAEVKSGRYQQALASFSTEAGMPAGTEDYVLFYHGQALLGLGRHEEAYRKLKEYEDLRPRRPLYHDARLLRVEALTGQGLLDEAVEEYRGLLRGERKGEAALRLADIFKKQDRTGEALETYRLAMKDSYSPSVRRTALRKYKELLSSATLYTGGEKLYLDLARLLRQEWQLEDALALINGLESIGGSPEYLSDLAYEKGRVLLFLNKPREACEHFQRTAQTGPPAGRSHFLSLHGDCLRRTGNWEEAGKVFLEAARASETQAQAVSNYFQAGVMFLKAGKKNEADRVWNLIPAKERDHGLTDDMLWRTAWHHYGLQSWTAAAEAFRRLSEKKGGSEKAIAGRYWLARSLEKTGDKAEAEKHYRFIAGQASQPYYRLLAWEQLRRNLLPEDGWLTKPSIKDLQPVPDVKYPAFTEDADSFSSPDLATERIKLMMLLPMPEASAEMNQALIRLRSLASAGALDLAFMEAAGLKDQATSDLKNDQSRLTGERLKQKTRDLSSLRAKCFSFMSAFLSETREFNQLFRLQYNNRSLFPEPESAADESAARRRLYPLYYFPEVSEAAREFGLDQALVLAVIRTESLYNRLAVSVSNALGLMQILPSTGRKIAVRLERPDFDPAELFKPELNIRFGAWYLSALSSEFNGHYVLALAAYNAGPFNVKLWLEQAGEVDLEEFIDQIPFEQARNYVKKNLVYYYMYHLNYTGKMIDFDLRRPLDKTHQDLVDF